MGFRSRGTITFEVERNDKGERCVRWTRPAQVSPRTTRYSVACRICQGDDDRTYVLELRETGTIIVVPGTFKYPPEEEILPGELRYPIVRALF